MTKTEKKTFNNPGVAIKPTTSNVGYVAEVGDTYVSSSGNYLVTPITIQGIGGATQTKTWLTFHPEWLSYTFNVKNLDSAGEFLYRKNVMSGDDKDLALLEGMAGSEENFAELCERLDAIEPIGEDGLSDCEDYCTAFTNRLIEFFFTLQPRFGYVLKQRMEKTNAINPETGYAIKVRSKYSDVDHYYYATDKRLEAERKRAKKNAEKIATAQDSNESADNTPIPYVVTFDEDVPF